MSKDCLTLRKRNVSTRLRTAPSRTRHAYVTSRGKWRNFQHRANRDPRWRSCRAFCLDSSLLGANSSRCASRFRSRARALAPREMVAQAGEVWGLRRRSCGAPNGCALPRLGAVDIWITRVRVALTSSRPSSLCSSRSGVCVQRGRSAVAPRVPVGIFLRHLDGARSACSASSVWLQHLPSYQALPSVSLALTSRRAWGVQPFRERCTEAREERVDCGPSGAISGRREAPPCLFRAGPFAERQCARCSRSNLFTGVLHEPECDTHVRTRRERNSRPRAAWSPRLGGEARSRTRPKIKKYQKKKKAAVP